MALFVHLDCEQTGLIKLDDLLPMMTGEWGVIVWIARWMQHKVVATHAWASHWDHQLYQEQFVTTIT